MSECVGEQVKPGIILKTNPLIGASLQCMSALLVREAVNALEDDGHVQRLRVSEGSVERDDVAARRALALVTQGNEISE